MESIVFTKSPNTIVTIGVLSYEHIAMLLKNTPTDCTISAYHCREDKILLNLKEKFKEFPGISVEYGDRNWLDNIIMGNVDIIHSNVEINPSKFINLLSRKGIIVLEDINVPITDFKSIRMGNLTLIKE